MQPPRRFASATFSAYHAQEPSQVAAREEARAFVRHIRARQGWPTRLYQRLPRWLRTLTRTSEAAESGWQGLYLVGPVGTGKTHLLASMYHALHPDVRCAFLHASELFRTTEPPEAFAQQLAERYRVLCLDEVELDDPANEARLVLTLKSLSHLGVVLLATSNVEPERFLSAAFGNDRFQRFLDEEFRQNYKVIFVGGDDYRRGLEKAGHAWIGPPRDTRPLLRRRFEADPGKKLWMDFQDLLAASTETEHTRLVRRLTRPERLYLADLAPQGTDDALRLLRLIDDLYLHAEPPALYFTAPKVPEAWLRADTAHGSLEKGIAEKFTRTASRLHALCEIEVLEGKGERENGRMGERKNGGKGEWEKENTAGDKAPPRSR